MILDGVYYQEKIQEKNYSDNLKQCIEKACNYCIYDESSVPLMMLGKIQSGKTNAFIGLMALAFDNDFDMVFILTKNSSALVEQTRKRMKKEFHRSVKDGDVDIFDIIYLDEDLGWFEQNKKLIVIAKKEKSNLDRILKFIEKYSIDLHKKVIIIDDEADTTGIGFERERETDEFCLRTVADKVNTMREKLPKCSFVQVTATPYSLYLQPEFDEAADIKPIRPMETVLVPSGEGYVGLDYYFVDSQKPGDKRRFIFQPISDEEHELVSEQRRNGRAAIEDGRRIKPANFLDEKNRLKVLVRGVINFIVGSCVLRIEHTRGYYSFVIHTATQINIHKAVGGIVQEIIKKLADSDEGAEKNYVEKLMLESYADIQKSVSAFDIECMPSFEIIRQAFYKSLKDGYVKVILVNSKSQMKQLLDEDTGELRQRTPMSIFVGGSVLDRGVTIPNMIGFYYGRNPKTMQQDTVLQHSRMFGYRDERLMSVTRFYTTNRIYSNMMKIAEIDIELRDDIEQGKNGEGIYFIGRRLCDNEDGKIIPCAPSKTAMSNMEIMKPGRRVLPVGFDSPKTRNNEKLLHEIDQLVSKYRTGEPRELAIVVNVDEIIPMLNKVYGLLNQDEDYSRFIDYEKFVTMLRYLVGDNKKGKKVVQLIVRKNRNLSKRRDNGMYQDAPDTTQDELKIAREVATDHPALILIQQNGKVEDGWSGSKFWWPILVTQQNVKRAMFSLPEQSGNLNTR